jgi:hypothetical protein
MRRSDANNSLPVIVPRSEKRLAPASPERIRRLRQHLIEIILDLRKAEAKNAASSALAPEPEGFVRLVANAACAFCKGVYCRHADDHGYIDDEALTRVRLLHSWLSAEEVMRMYLDRIPQSGYRDCVFSTAKRAAPWIGPCGRISATATFVAASRRNRAW